MAVLVECEAEVADVVRTVCRQGLTAQHDVLDGLALIGTGGAIENTGKIAGGGAARRKGTMAVHRKECAQGFQSFITGPVMDPEQAILAPGSEFPGRRNIGRDHQLLDETMAVQAVSENDVADVAPAVETDLAFSPLDLEGASPIPPASSLPAYPVISR